MKSLNTSIKRRSIFLSFSIFVSLTCAESNGADWIYLKSSKGGANYLDSETIDRGADGKVRAWFRLDLTDPASASDDKGSYVSAIQYLEFSCRKKTVRQLRFSGFSQDGIAVVDKGEKESSDYIIPDSIYETYATSVCKPIPHKKTINIQKDKLRDIVGGIGNCDLKYMPLPTGIGQGDVSIYVDCENDFIDGVGTFDMLHASQRVDCREPSLLYLPVKWRVIRNYQEFDSKNQSPFGEDEGRIGALVTDAVCGR